MSLKENRTDLRLSDFHPRHLSDYWRIRDLFRREHRSASGRTRHTDWTDLHRFFYPRHPSDYWRIRDTCPTTGGSATPVRLLADPQLVRLLADPHHLSDHRRIRVLHIRVLFFYQKSLHLILHILPSHLNFETQAIVGTLHSIPQA